MTELWLLNLSLMKHTRAFGIKRHLKIVEQCFSTNRVEIKNDLTPGISNPSKEHNLKTSLRILQNTRQMTPKKNGPIPGVGHLCLGVIAQERIGKKMQHFFLDASSTTGGRPL